MVASPRAQLPLYQQQESPTNDSPSPSPEKAAGANHRDFNLPGEPGPLHNQDHTFLNVNQAPKEAGTAPAQPVAADGRATPEETSIRPSFWKDPFGWVLRPRKISHHQRIVLIIFGRIGWCAKAIIYSIIGGLCCKSSVQGRNGTASASPQGAFILIGNNDVGVPLLVVLAVMLALYSGWRFWEGIIGAGTDAQAGKLKNFFRYRLSPMVSGCVYLAYMAYILSLLAKTRAQRLGADDNRTWPNSWRNSDGGKFGLAMIGVAFLAAFAAQLEMILTPAFHREMKQGLPCIVRWTAIISGHIGFTGRAGFFILIAILFFRTIEKDTGDETTVANALYQLQGNAGGRFALFLLGWGLIVYGLYATMCGLYVREFPTRPRSGVLIVPLEHARHLWNKRREWRLQQKEDMMRATLGLDNPDRLAHVNGHAAGNGAVSPPATEAPTQPEAGYPPSRVYVPAGNLPQV